MKKLLLSVAVLAVLTAPVYAKPYLDIQEIKTESGVKAWIVTDRSIPLWSLQFSLKGGSQHDPIGKEGLVSLLSSTLDEGAGKRDAENVQNTLDSHGIRMGFSASRDRFVGSLKTTVTYQDTAIELFRDALNDPHFDKDAVERMKQAILSNQRFQKMDPAWVAQKTLFEELFPGRPYGRLVEGTEESVKSLTADDLKAVKKEMFCKEDLLISIVGSIEKFRARKIVDDVFGDWPSCEDRSDVVETEPENLGKRIDVPWIGAAQSVVIMAQKGLARQNKDWWAARVLDFALGGGEFSSRLMDEVRVKRGMTYGVSSSLMPYDLSPLWFVESSIDPVKTEEAIVLIKKIWGDVAKDGLTDAEIAEAKSYLIGSLPLALTSTDQIAAIVLQLQEDKLPMETLDKRAEEINAVTKDDIKRVAAKYLNEAELTTIVVGPPKEEEKKK